MLVLLMTPVACFVWIAVWSLKGFRSRGWQNPERIRAIATITFTGALVFLVLFPPQLRVGVWENVATGEPLPAWQRAHYDGFKFGRIPTFVWIGRGENLQYGEQSGRYSLHSSETYVVDAYYWRIDWITLIALMGIILIAFFPFLAASGVVLQDHDQLVAPS
ncbi:MAG: hypothetical protein NXI22_10475 [bacterium]|nr:hypothetical protein [bacterium]